MKTFSIKKTRLAGVAIAALVLSLLGPVAAAPAAAGPMDCAIPGVDDRCEKWVHRYTEGQAGTPFGKYQHQHAYAGAIAKAGTMAFQTGNRTDGSRVCYVGSTPVLCNDLQTVAYDVVTGEVAWVAHEPPPWEEGEALPRTIVVSADDTVVYVVATVFTGAGSASDTTRDVQVVAYDAATGKRLWMTLYDGPAGRQDDAFAAAASPVDDRLFVAAAATATQDPVFPGGYTPLYVAKGTQAGGLETDVDFALVEIDGATGTVIDEQRYGGPSFTVDGKRHASWDIPTEIRVSRDGRRVVLAGMSDGREHYKSNMPHSAVVAWDADEDGVWRRAWVREMPGVPLGLGLVESQDTVAFAGVYGQGGTENNPYAVVGLDAESGAPTWETRFALGGNQLEYPRSLLVDEQRGAVYLPGLSRSPSASYGTSGALALRAADGSQLWRTRLRDFRSTATVVFNYDNDSMTFGALDPASGHLQLTSARDGKLATFSLHRQTGAVRWSSLFEHPTRPQPYLEQSAYDWPMGMAAAAGRTVIFGNSYIPYRQTCNSSSVLGALPCSRNDFLTVAYEV